MNVTCAWATPQSMAAMVAAKKELRMENPQDRMNSPTANPPREEQRTGRRSCCAAGRNGRRQHARKPDWPPIRPQASDAEVHRFEPIVDTLLQRGILRGGKLLERTHANVSRYRLAVAILSACVFADRDAADGRRASRHLRLRQTTPELFEPPIDAERSAAKTVAATSAAADGLIDRIGAAAMEFLCRCVVRNRVPRG